MRNRRDFLLSLTALAAPASRIRYVSTARELSAAMKAVGAGETIVMADGEWNDCDLLFQAEGAPGRPVTLRAETTGKVVLRGESRLSIGGVTWWLTDSVSRTAMRNALWRSGPAIPRRITAG
jgi:hypothetical protein